jgi:DNA-binding SARP family transcriptional activator/tetratricopeptide (TPR) repeat protein
VQNVRLRILGDLQLEGCDTAQLGRRQVRTMLKILALGHGQFVGVDRLVDCLWGDTPPARPSEQISVLASRLRGVLGAERVLHSDAGYMVILDWLDLDALREYLAEADRRLASEKPAAARTIASAGLSLIRGPLLADEPDAWWADSERAAADLVISRLHQIVASAALTAGDWAEAAHRAGEMLLRDPYDESALRVSMEALARSGRQASALAAYAALRERLAEELGVSPSDELEALHSAILMGNLPIARDSGERSASAIVELPGRASHLRLLDDLIARVELGHGQIAVVEGEAGIGKTRLLQFWAERMIGTGVEVVSVACDELGRTLPLQPILDAIEALVRSAGSARILEILGADVAVLGPLLGTPAEPVLTSQLAALTDPVAGQALLFAALFSVLRRWSGRQSLVLIIDDIHLADSATTAWLGQAARRLVNSRVMIVAGQRAEEGVALPGATIITLGPLTLEDAGLIVEPHRAPALFARSGGHPLFLVELAAADADEEMPATIRAAVEERCTRAGAAAATLRAAAVIGPEVDLEVLTVVTSTGTSELLDHLEEGLARRLLAEEGQTFVFAHALIREALASTVGASRTAFIHREAARTLGGRPGADFLAVARHARLGGELVHASTALVAAARMAVLRFDEVEAMRLLDEAISLDDTADARLERARVATMASRYEQAAEDIAAARLLGAGPEALEVAAWSAHFQRHFDEALANADRGAQEAVDPDLRTSCLALGGWVSLASGDLDGAEVRLEGALADATATSGGMAEVWLAWLRMNQGRPAETLSLVTRLTGTGLAAYRFPRAYGGMVATMALAMLGRADEALSALDMLESDVARMGAHRWTARPLNLRGWIVRNLGGLDEADELNQAAIDAARVDGLDEPLANGLLDLASGRLLAGDLDGADTLLREAMALTEVEHAFRWRHQLRGRLLRARLQHATRDFDGALPGAESLATDCALLGTPRYEIQARLVAAMSSHQAGVTPELETVGELLARLDEVAGLEGWWITAEVARVFGVHEWVELAGRRVASLRRRAGARAEALDRAATRYLG